MNWSAAIEKLDRLVGRNGTKPLTPDRINAYIKDYPAYRERMAALWHNASCALGRLPSFSIPRLLCRLKIVLNAGGSQWDRGMGRLLGWSSREAVESCFCKESSGQGGANPEHYRLNPSRGRVFRGSGWTDVLTIPYYDFPQRLSGFLFIGRQGDAEDRIFRPRRVWARSGSNQYVIQPRYRPEAGLHGLHTAESESRELGSTVFTINDAVLGLRLQNWHWHLWRRLLPLVCWHDGPTAMTRDTWRLLSGRRIVFWGWKLDASLLHQAVQADGYLALAGPRSLTPAAIEQYVNEMAPMNRLRQLQRRAKPWRETVREWALQQPAGVIEQLLLGLEQYHIDLPRLVAECGGSELKSLLPLPRGPRTIQIGNRTIAERSTGWFVVQRSGREVPLLNACFRIERVFEKHSQTWYGGHITFGGEDIFYEVPASVMQQHPARWLRDYLMRLHKGIVHYHSGVRDLVEIALKFHEPALE